MSDTEEINKVNEMDLAQSPAAHIMYKARQEIQIDQVEHIGFYWTSKMKCIEKY